MPDVEPALMRATEHERRTGLRGRGKRATAICSSTVALVKASRKRRAARMRGTNGHVMPANARQGCADGRGCGEPAIPRAKRLHNHLHGDPGDGGPLASDERARYERILAANLADMVTLIDGRDLVLLHDPQTAGMVDGLRAAGARVP